MKPVMKSTVTPEFLAESGTHSKSEKLELLDSMRRDALEKSRAEGGDADADIDAIDRAIEVVKADAEEPSGIAIGRATSA